MNFQNIVKTAQEGVSVTVFFDEGITQEKIEEIGALIDKRPEVSKRNLSRRMKHGKALRPNILPDTRTGLPKIRWQILQAMRFI